MKLLKVDCKKRYVFMPEHVWDGVSDKLFNKYAISIEQGIVNYVGPLSNLVLTDNHKIEVIELPGQTLIPGLTDCHVHFAMNCYDLPKAIEQWETEPVKSLESAVGYARNYIENGVLAVRDGSDKANIGFNLTKKLKSAQISAPLITATGQAIYKKGMYGSFLGSGVTTVKEAANQITSLRKEDVHQIKVVISGLVSFKKFGFVGPSQFTLDELKEIVDAAHENELKVMAHASSSESVELAVLAGVDSVEHGYFLEEKQIEMMAKRNTAWVPTLAPLGNLLKNQVIPYPGADLNIIKKSFEIQLSRLAEAFKSGVVIGIGTDAGANNVPHGNSYHNELHYYKEAGLDNLSILRMATSTSAVIIGKEKYIGTIKPGLPAYWCCYTGNPLEDIDILKKPEMVVIPNMS